MTIPGKDIAFDLRNRKSTSVTAAQASGILPAGGATGSILTKNTATDYDVSWQPNTAIQKGDGIFVQIRNNTGSTLTKGQIVYTNGATGAKVTVALARADADVTSARTLGWVSEDILVNDNGWVQIEGYLSGIDTASIADGSQLYLSPTTAGAFTATKPSAPDHMVYVGVVAKSANAAGGGAVLIKAQNGYELDELHNVNNTSLADKDVLSYESSTSLWKNKTLANAGIAALAGATFTGPVVFNNNTTEYGTHTQWANQQLSLAVRNGTNYAGNLVQYSLNDTTITGGVTARGLLWAGSTGFENNPTHNLSATNPFLTSSTATFTVSTVQTYNPFAVGQKIIVSGASQAQYNGSWISTAVGGSSGAWTVTISSGSGTTPFTNSGAITATGTIALEPAGFFKQPSPGAVGIVIKGAGISSTATDIFRYVNSSGSTQTYITAAGDIVAPAISAIWSITTSAQDRNVIPLRARFSVTNGQANIQTWESSTAVVAGVNPRGQLFTGGTVPATGSTTISFAPTVAPTGTTDITITLASNHNIAVGQTVVVSGVTPAGYNGTWRAQNGTTGSTLVLNIGSNPGAVTVNGTMRVSPQMSITPDNLASSSLVIKNIASQTVPAFEIQDSSNNLLSYFKADGSLYINSNSNTTGVYFKGTASDQSIRANGNDLFITPRFDLIFNPNDTTGRLRPVNDNQSDLGTSGQRWKTLFATGATLNGLTLSSTTSPITLNGSVGTSGQVLTSQGAGATPIWTTVSGGTFTGGTLTSTLILDDGTTTTAPLKFDATSTTLLTTPQQGAVEYDGKATYVTPDTTPGRAVNWTPHYITFSSGPDFSTVSSAVSIIDGATKGITLLAGMTYEFELHAALRYQSFGDTTTALNIGWNTSTVSGTPTVSWVEYLEYASNTTNFTTAATMNSLRRTSGTFQIAASPGGAGTNRYVIYKQKGLLTITGTGSIKFYPTLSASAVTANVPTYQSGSIFMVTPLGNGTFTQVGAWA